MYPCVRGIDRPLSVLVALPDSHHRDSVSCDSPTRGDYPYAIVSRDTPDDEHELLVCQYNISVCHERNNRRAYDLHPRRQERIHDSRKTEKECSTNRTHRLLLFAILRCEGNHGHCTVESFRSSTEGSSCESYPQLEDGEESVVRLGLAPEINE